MKSDFEILNELARESHFLHELSADESAKMKAALLEMYKDVAALCQKEQLTIMLCGGTCLGAVRHQGFIPWDDDLDIMMPRKDYDRLIALLAQGALGDKYEYSAPNSKTDSANVWLKIYRKNSLDVDIYNATSPFPKGLYLDVFALDAVPKSKLAQKIKGFIANGLQFCAILTLYTTYPSPQLKEFMFMNPTLRKRYRIKKFLGHIVGVIPRRKWVWWFDQFVSDSSDDKPWGIPTGRKYYCGEIFQRSVYMPSIEATFEQTKAFIPNGYDQYLTNLYHNYMQLPPLNKRERHFVYQFQLPND